MLSIAIDGACRRNGKPNCIASGGVFIQHFDSECTKLLQTKVVSNYELQSTNQRGELLALVTALDYVASAKLPAQILTDSEYLFNTMTKEWYKNWSNKGWVTSLGEPVKNKDMWHAIMQAYDRCDTEVMFYHIKGHCIPFGKVTANNLLNVDTSGHTLMLEVAKKFEAVKDAKKDIFEAASELSNKNNGFGLHTDLLKRFVVSNVVADAVATKCVEAADALM